jgi:hypothetical protein
MNRSKLLARFKEELDTCCRTIPSDAAAEERENVLAWAKGYVNVKVSVAVYLVHRQVKSGFRRTTRILSNAKMPPPWIRRVGRS